MVESNEKLYTHWLILVHLHTYYEEKVCEFFSQIFQNKLDSRLLDKNS